MAEAMDTSAPNGISKYLSDLDLEEEAVGEFQWSLEDFSKLQVKAAAGASPEERKILSPIYTTPNNDKWRMVLFPAGKNNSGGYMSLYLECCSDDKSVDPKWHRCVQFCLRAANPSDESVESFLGATHRYVPQDIDWGFESFFRLDELMAPVPPYDKPIVDVEKNALNLYAYIRIFKDQTGVLWHNFSGWDSKKETGFVGLKNQGATCYMNSLLQSLYFTSYFRKAVFQIPTDKDDATKSIPYALQRLFYQLQHSDQAIDTRELTQSFGWNTIDAFMQHDVQEFNRVLQDNLETKMKGTKAEGSIERLFVGKMKSYIKCVNVEYESSRVETFYDIQLNVKGKKDLLESFDDYIQVEMLDGENKYQSEKYGLQDAKKGVIFTEFPPVLHLQLKRFEYDFQRDQMVKINDRHEYPKVIDLSNYLDDGSMPKQTPKYRLHGVLVHIGDVHGGHYCAFIKPTANSLWYKFDDDRVVPVTEKEVYDDNFGGDFTSATGALMDRQARFHKSFTNAYMLVYVREADRDEILAEVTSADIPAHLCRQLEHERLEAERVAKERAERHLFINVSVLQDTDVKDYQGFDLWNWDIKEVRPAINLKIRKDETIADLKKMIAEACNRPLEQCRIWHFASRQNGSFRQDMPISEKSDSDSMETTFMQRAKGLYELRLWLEISDARVQDSDGRIAFFHSIAPNDRVMLFVKYFDPSVPELKYMKSISAKLSMKISELSPSLVAMVGLPPSTPIRIYEEVKPGMISALKPKDTLRMCELSSGDILCVQKDISKEEEKQYEYPNAPSFYDYLHNRVFIRLIPRSKGNEDKTAAAGKELIMPFSKRITYDHLATKIGEKLHVDPLKLQFYVNPTGYDIPKQIIKRIPNQSLHEILHSNYYSTTVSASPVFWYEILEVSILELETKRLLKLTLLSDQLKEGGSIELLVPKAGTVQDLIQQLSEKVPHYGHINIVEVFAHRHLKFLKPTDNISQITENGTQLYVQPADERHPMQAASVTVFHFNKEVSHSHSIPFKLSVEATEAVGDVKIRIKDRLGFSEKEMEKIKIAIVTANNRVLYPEDDGSAIGEFWEPGSCIGLDHPDRSASKKLGLWQDKAIKIHN